MVTALVMAFAVLLDGWLGEPRRYHPLVGFGRLAQGCERRCYGAASLGRRQRRGRGVVALVLVVTPFVALAAWIDQLQGWNLLFELGLLYLALGGHSLVAHSSAVAMALRAGDLPAAREAVGMIVSRDTSELDESAISAAAVESVLENGNDAIFGALFWFLLAGAPGVVLFRLVNTLDAMWGYRNERYRDFGWAAARLDDLLNFIPARLTALSYALLGQGRRALRCWQRQGRIWKSPNAGPVMAAGAGSLGLRLGGAAIYHGELQVRPALGEGRLPVVEDIERANRMVRRAVALWLAVVVGGALVGEVWRA